MGTRGKGMSVHTLRVYGKPIAQGSKKAFVHPHTGRAVVTEQLGKELKNWRASVAQAAGDYVEAHPGEFPVVAMPIKAVFAFFLPRPKAHYSAKGGVKDSFLRFPHIIAPDFDKLVRATADACTGILWQNDALLTDVQVSKRYADPAPIGVAIELATIQEIRV